MEWKPIPECPQVEIRLRNLKEDETKDTSDQLFTFDVKVPLVFALGNTAPIYSAHLYEKLSESRKKEFDRLAKEYFDLSWWLPDDANYAEDLT